MVFLQYFAKKDKNKTRVATAVQHHRLNYEYICIKPQMDFHVATFSNKS